MNESHLSKHLQSRQAVEHILESGAYSFTALRAGIIVGSGSASFEIIRDIVEKLPIMITPRWLKTRTQPIAIRDVVAYLKGVISLPEAKGKSFDISSGEIFTYKELLLKFAKVRGLKRTHYCAACAYPTGCLHIGYILLLPPATNWPKTWWIA